MVRKKSLQPLRGPLTRKPVDQISDRAKRYRAHQPGCRPPGPRRCALCGSRRFVVIDHKNGDESDSSPRNLRYLCKSCNVREGRRLARAGRGVRTRQYNPGECWFTEAVKTALERLKAEKRNPGARTLREYIDAALQHTRGAYDAGGKIIHETPKEKRQEFAAEIWRRRRARGTDRRH